MRIRESDRRQYGMANRFPLEDKAECIIPFNRSNKPDRRLRNLALRVIDCEEFSLHSADRCYGS